MTETVRNLVANMTPSEREATAMLIADAMASAATLPAPSVAVLLFHGMLGELARYGTPVPSLEAALAACDARSLCTALAICSAFARTTDSPYPACAHQIVNELTLAIQAARILGGHLLSQDRERTIDRLLDEGDIV